MARPTGLLRIPAAPLSAGVPLPAACIRHGEPAVATRPVTFLSRTPAWVGLFIIFTIVVPIVLTLVLRKRVKAAAIPVCDECVADRSLRLRAMTAALVSTAVLISGCLRDPETVRCWPLSGYLHSSSRRLPPCLPAHRPAAAS